MKMYFRMILEYVNLVSGSAFSPCVQLQQLHRPVYYTPRDVNLILGATNYVLYEILCKDSTRIC